MNANYQLFINGSFYQFIKLKIDHEPRDISKMPKFTLTLPNRFGTNTNNTDFNIGKIVDVYRESELIFKGVIEPQIFTMSSNTSILELTGSNLWYKRVSNVICDSYDFIESSTDYGVTINPWEIKPLVYTHPNVTLTNIGRERPILDGFLINDVAEHLVGTKFLFSHDFQDNTYLLPSTTKTSTSNLTVYRDTKTSGSYYQTTPRLQLIHNGSSGSNTIYQNTGVIESISLYNGDPNIESMGNINSINIVLYGKLNGGTISLSICRNGQNSYDPIGGNNFNKSLRTYIPISLTNNDLIVPGTSDTITKFTGSIGINNWGIASTGNQLAYKLTFTAASGNTSTPELEYIMFNCSTNNDTGVSSGIIDTYIGDNSISGSNFFLGNFESKTRLASLSDLRNATIKIYDGSNEDDLISAFWDIWIDVSGSLNFKKNRGSIINGHTYSFENSSFSKIEYEYDGSDIWYKVVAYGAGSGIYRTRIVSDEEFDSGGLTIQSVKTTYGDAAKIGSFEDSSQNTVNQLYRKARGALKLHSRPFESLKFPSGLIPEQTRYYDVADIIYVTINDLQIINRLFPIEELSRTIDKQGEKIEVVLGSPLASISKALSYLTTGQQDIQIVRQASGGKSGLTGEGVYFDSTHYGVYAFGISEPEKIKKVALKAVTVPFDGHVRASKSGSAHTHTIVGTATGAGGGGVFDATFNDKSATSESKDVGTQSVSSASLSNPNLSGASANAQSLSGATANNPVNVGTQQAFASTGSFTVSSSGSTVVHGTMSAVTTTSVDGFMCQLQVTGGDNVDWRLELIIDTNSGTYTIWEDFIASFDDGYDILRSIYVPGDWLRYLSITSVSGIKLFAKPTSGANQVLDFAAVEIDSIPLHTHATGSLANASSSVSGGAVGSSLTGNTSTKNIQYTNIALDATAINNLFNNLKLGYKVDSGGTGTTFIQNGITYYEEHQHSLTGIALGDESAHTHGMDFGIFTFGGDSDTIGNGPSLFGSNINIWIDPVNESSPESSSQFPISFGQTGASVEIDELDITAWLKRDSNGLIKRGIHKIFIKSSTSDTNNTKGLGKVQLVTLDTYKEDKS